MLIEFNANIFDDPDNLRKLMFLINLCYIDRRYSFFIDVEEIKDKPLYKLLNNSDKDLLNEYYIRRVTESQKVTHTINNESGADTFNLDEGRAYLNQPLLIVLENSEYDAYFIDAILTHFKKGKILKRHINERWAKYENGGGYHNIENVLTRYLTSFENLSQKPTKYLRCFVLVDSDSRFPGEIKPDRHRLISFLNDHSIAYHILEKREMENYMPDEVVSDISNNEEYLQAYLRLTPVQKDYFDIQYGFPNKNFEQFPDEVKDLFETVSEDDKKLFRAKTFTPLDTFKSDFPKNFKHKNVTKDTLNKRIAHREKPNEYEVIIDKLTLLL